MGQLYSKPLAVPDAVRPGMLTEALTRSMYLRPLIDHVLFIDLHTVYIFMLLQRPPVWEIGSEVLSEAINGDGTALLNSIQYGVYDLERPAVSCNDNMPFKAPSAEEIIDEWLDVYENVTRFVFSTVITEPDSGCIYWPVTPPERFNGPWNHTLKNQILVMSSLVRLFCSEVLYAF